MIPINSLHRKWLEITKHPINNGCLGFQVNLNWQDLEGELPDPKPPFGGIPNRRVDSAYSLSRRHDVKMWLMKIKLPSCRLTEIRMRNWGQKNTFALCYTGSSIGIPTMQIVFVAHFPNKLFTLWPEVWGNHHLEYPSDHYLHGQHRLPNKCSCRVNDVS